MKSTFGLSVAAVGLRSLSLLERARERAAPSPFGKGLGRGPATKSSPPLTPPKGRGNLQAVQSIPKGRESKLEVS